MKSASALVMFLAVACSASVPSPTPDRSADDRAVLEGFNAAMNRHDFDAAGEFVGAEVALGDDYTLSEPGAIRRELMTYRKLLRLQHRDREDRERWRLSRHVSRHDDVG